MTDNVTLVTAAAFRELEAKLAEADDCAETSETLRAEAEARLAEAVGRATKAEAALRYIVQRGYTGAEFVARQALGAAPAWWQLVPCEPEGHMWAAGKREFAKYASRWAEASTEMAFAIEGAAVEEIYKAMLAAHARNG